MIPVFDGHNDILYRIQRAPENRAAIWLGGDGKGHLDLPRMQASGFAGGYFAIYIASPGDFDSADMDAPLDPMLAHLDHLIKHLGEDHVGFGSDFDGATMPKDIGNVTGLPRLQDAMRAHGYDDALMRKLCFENWLALLGSTLA